MAAELSALNGPLAESVAKLADGLLKVPEKELHKPRDTNNTHSGLRRASQEELRTWAPIVGASLCSPMQ